MDGVRGMTAEEKVAAWLARARAAAVAGEGLGIGGVVTGVLAKYDGDDIEGKEPVEVMRFVEGKLVEHLVHGQAVPVEEDAT